jgi:RIO kinase 1
MSRRNAVSELPSELWDDDWITGDPVVVRSGKEATVYRCRAHPRQGRRWIAAKRYRPVEHRGFRNDAVYREGRVILDARIRRAVAKKTRMGRRADFALWMGYEHETLTALHRAGADVPESLAIIGDTVLMEYIGDEDGPAPLLAHVDLEVCEARRYRDAILRNVEMWLACNVIHADLSPFNVLCWDGRAIVIDFPQAVDPRFNPNARNLLHRDIESICSYFARFGVETDAEGLSRRLWTQFRFARS